MKGRRESRLLRGSATLGTLAVVGTIGVLGWPADGGSADVEGIPPAADMPYGDDLGADGLRTGVGYDLYWLESEFRGLKLSGIDRQDGPAPKLPETMPTPERKPGRIDNVTFLYGTCETQGDLGCPIPLQIQVWPACQRNLADYTYDGKNPLPHVRRSIRGVPAAQFEDRLELYTGASTVVIFGENREVETAAAASLVHVSKPIGIGARLPEPVSGVLTGQIPGCQR